MASGVALVLRILLAGIFAFAALGKLSDRDGTAAAVRGFGIPAVLAGGLALLLPLAELSVAALLLPAGTARIGAIGALALLALFSLAIALNLARGRRPRCHCFGQSGAEPISARTLVRNGLLAVAAAMVLAVGAGPGLAAPLVSSPLLALVTGLAAGLGVAGWVGFALTRRHGRALRRIDLLERELLALGADLPEEAPAPVIPIGSPVPNFDGLAELLAAGQPLLLTFTSPECGPCRELAPILAGWRADYGDTVSFAELDYDDDPALALAFGAEATPAAIAIAADATAASALVHGPTAIESLVADTVSAHAPPPAEIGDEVPEIALSRFDGERSPLRSVIATGRDTLLLFWNPGCGFCSAMRDDVRSLEDGESGLALAIISSGDSSDVEAEGFACPVLLDPRWRAADALGAHGTPVALLIGADGTIRSAPAGGRSAVLDMAGFKSEKTYELEVIR